MIKNVENAKINLEFSRIPRPRFGLQTGSSVSVSFINEASLELAKAQNELNDYKKKKEKGIIVCEKKKIDVSDLFPIHIIQQINSEIFGLYNPPSEFKMSLTINGRDINFVEN